MEFITKIKDIVIPKAVIKGLTCDFIVEETPPSFISDPRRLLQVMLNLAFNAIKYTFTGGIVIKFSKTDSRLRFEIKDTGIGIPASDLEKLNKLFGLLDKKLMGNETGIMRFSN